MSQLIAAIVQYLKPILLPAMAELVLEIAHRLRSDPEFLASLDMVTIEYKKAQESGDKEKRSDALKSFQRLIAGRDA